MLIQKALPPGGRRSGIKLIAWTGPIDEDCGALPRRQLWDLVEESGGVEECLTLGWTDDLGLRPRPLGEGIGGTSRVFGFTLDCRGCDGTQMMLQEFDEQGFAGGVGVVLGALR
jgi:hypothetical protein